jgi:hypothetical protein
MRSSQVCTRSSDLEKATTVEDGGAGFVIIYLNFTKAVDKVPRERLLNKVRAHGI